MGKSWWSVKVLLNVYNFIVKKNQDLFDLIRSLSRTEKRYFTLDARKAGKRQSRYLQLFQEINKLDEYDETGLKKQFKLSLVDDKARLYEAILRVMRDFRSSRSQTARIKELLLDANFLYERGLYEQSEKRLEEAKQIATILEDQLALLEINRESRRVVNTLLRFSDKEVLEKLQQNTHVLLGLLEAEFRYLTTHDELIRELHSMRHGTLAPQKDELKTQYNEQLFVQPEPTSLQARLRYYQARAMFSQLMNDSAGMYENFKRVNQLWNQHLAYKTEEFNRYLDDAFNLLHATFQYPSVVNEASTLLDNLSAEKPASAHDRQVLFQRTATFRLIYTINFDNRRSAHEVLAPIEEGLSQYDLNPVSELTIRYNGATLLFIQNSPKVCEQWLMSIIDLQNNAIRPDIVMAARLLRILTLVEQEMDNNFIIAQIRAEQRYLLKQPDNRMKEFARWLLSTIKRSQQIIPSEITQLMYLGQKEVKSTWQGLPLGLDEFIERYFQAKAEHKCLLDVM